MTLPDDDDDDLVPPPEGVRLRDPNDTDGMREDIEQGVLKAMQNYVHGYEYGGTRIELTDLAYADRPRYTLAEQREALLKDATLARRLRGTVTLVDTETNKPLEVRKNITLARVPYLTQRGTMIHNGSEYAPVSQSRLLPGAYTRRRNNGELETHFNTRPGTGSAIRMSLDPQTGQYRLRVGTSNVHAYSVLKDIGVTDEEMERRWGPEILEANRKGYDQRAIDRVYAKAIPKWRRDAALPRAEKAREVVEAFGRAQVARAVLRDNLPNLYSREKAASWRLQGRAMEKLAGSALKARRKAVIVKGNPKWVEGPHKEQSEALYDSLRKELEAAGFDVDFDAGEPYTSPPPADLWVGHSRGIDRLRFAPQDTLTLPVDHFQEPFEFDPDNPEWEPPASHYDLTPDLVKQIRALSSSAKPVDDIVDPPADFSLVEKTKEILKKSAAADPVKFKKIEPQAHHRYLADDDEHEEYEAIGVDGILAASEKLLAVNRGLERPDQRDTAANERVYTVDRLMAERIKLDHGKTLRTLMGRLSRRKNLSALGPAVFDTYTIDYLKGNPTASAIEEINPMNIMEQRRRITKMGQGGIGDPAAITIGMQSVDASQFGFISPAEGPESEKAGIDVRLAYGARIGSDGRIYQLMRNARTGKKQWVSPSDLKGKTVRLPD